MTKKLVVVSLAVMTTLLALVVFWQFRLAVVYVLISLMLAAAVRPMVRHLTGRGRLVCAAWILLYLAVLAGFVFFIFLAGQAVINEIQQFGHHVSAQDAWILPAWLQGSAFWQTLLGWLPPPSKLFEAITGSQGQLILPALFGFTQGMTGTVSGALVIVFLTLYWIDSQAHFERLWLSLLPSGQRKQARDIWRTIEPDLGAYIRSQVFHSLLAGVLLGLGYWALGSPYPMLLGLAGALSCLIPLVGPMLAVILPLGVGLLTGVQLSLLSVLFTLAVLIALGVWVKPRLFNRRWDNPILTLVLMIAMANALGLLGIIAAPPLSAVCQILWRLLVSHRLVSGAAEQISDLRERQDRLRENIKAMDGPPLPLISSSMERLNGLIVKAEPILQQVPTGQPAELLLQVAPQPKQEV